MLTGEICYIHGVDISGNLIIQLTKDCVPVDECLAINARGDDGFWHDVTSLVLEANSAILPPTSTTKFASDVAVQYRNYLNLHNVPTVTGAAAEGEICLLGEHTGNNVSDGIIYSKTGYYVVAHDDGWYIVYMGYCDPVSKDDATEETHHPLKVLMLGNKRNLYKASPIVDACSQAFIEDMELANKYTAEIQREIAESVGEQSNYPKAEVATLRMRG